MRRSVCALVLFALSTVSGQVDTNPEFNTNIIESLFEEFQQLNVAEPSAQPTAEHLNVEYNKNIIENLFDETQLLDVTDPSAEPTAEPTIVPSAQPSIGTILKC